MVDYEAQNFADGQILCAEHLNTIEQGILALAEALMEAVTAEDAAAAIEEAIAGMDLTGYLTQDDIATTEETDALLSSVFE